MLVPHFIERLLGLREKSMCLGIDILKSEDEVFNFCYPSELSSEGLDLGIERLEALVAQLSKKFRKRPQAGKRSHTDRRLVARRSSCLRRGCTTFHPG